MSEFSEKPIIIPSGREALLSKESNLADRSDAERFKSAKEFGSLRIAHVIFGLKDLQNGNFAVDTLQNKDLFNEEKIEQEFYDYISDEWKGDEKEVPENIIGELRKLAKNLVNALKQRISIDIEERYGKGKTMEKRVSDALRDGDNMFAQVFPR